MAAASSLLKQFFLTALMTSAITTIFQECYLDLRKVLTILANDYNNENCKIYPQNKGEMACEILLHCT